MLFSGTVPHISKILYSNRTWSWMLQAFLSNFFFFLLDEFTIFFVIKERIFCDHYFSICFFFLISSCYWLWILRTHQEFYFHKSLYLDFCNLKLEILQPQKFEELTTAWNIHTCGERHKNDDDVTNWLQHLPTQSDEWWV